MFCQVHKIQGSFFSTCTFCKGQFNWLSLLIVPLLEFSRGHSKLLGVIYSKTPAGHNTDNAGNTCPDLLRDGLGDLEGVSDCTSKDPFEEWPGSLLCEFEDFLEVKLDTLSWNDLKRNITKIKNYIEMNTYIRWHIIEQITLFSGSMIKVNQNINV